MKKYTAGLLLEIGAVELRPHEPFTWASGIQSPIYCDNRLTMSFPAVRKEIASGLAGIIQEQYPECEIVAGTATAGIPHAAWVSDLLNLPMVYVRSKAKGHGQGNLIEGKVQPGKKVVVVEDLISKGGSVLQAADALKAAGFEVVGIVAIFTYGLPQSEEALSGAGYSFHTLSDFPSLLEEAEDRGVIRGGDLPMLKEWHARLKAGTLTG